LKRRIKNPRPITGRNSRAEILQARARPKAPPRAELVISNSD